MLHPCSSSFAFNSGAMFSPAGEPVKSNCVRLFNFSKPSEIAAKTDMCENGSEMVQAKYKVKCEKINDLTFGNLVIQSPSELERAGRQTRG